MEQLFSQVVYEMEDNNDVVIATIVEEEGSSPRGKGAKMLVGKRGRILGTIGGGAVEKRSEEMALTFLEQKKTGMHHFELRKNEKEDIGMICGGNVTVLFQYVVAENKAWQDAAYQVREFAKQRMGGWIISPADGGTPSVWNNGALVCGKPVPEHVTAGLRENATLFADGYLAEAIPKGERVIVFGGGHVCQALVKLLPALNFRAVVLDNRPEYSRPELFPGAEEVITCDYERIGDYVDIRPEDYAVIMTNGHAHDYTVQAQVMKKDYVYLGVIGSRHKTVAINAKLREAGYPEEKIGKVYTPIGTAIKAVTPEEIGISIAGELILVRAQERTKGEAEHAGCPMHRE